MTTGIAIYPDKRVTRVELNALGDYQEIVNGYIEPVNLKFGTLWVNEEFLLGQFGPEDFNSIASDVAGLGGRPDLMLFTPILGPAILTGFVGPEGEDLDFTEAGERAVKRIAREAGGRVTL
jgi:hypothetical protein